MGVARKLREYNQNIHIIGVEPSCPAHKQEGLLNLEELRPEIFNPEEVDEIILVKDEDAFKTARDLFLRRDFSLGFLQVRHVWNNS